MRTFNLSHAFKRAMFICILMGCALTSRAQFLGVHLDSAVFCQGIQGGSFLGWYGSSASLSAGDMMDFYVDWGDGNTSNYMGNAITISGPTAYTNGILINHTYSTSGDYNVIVIGDVPGVVSDTLYDTLHVSSGCAYVNGTVLLDDGDGIFEWTDMPGAGIPMMVTTPTGSYGSTTSYYGSYSITNIDHSQSSYQLAIDPAWLTANGMSIVSPVAGSYTLNAPPYGGGYNFLLNCGNVYNDLGVTDYGWGFRAGMSTGYVITNLESFSCSGTMPDVTVTLTFDPMLTVYSSTLPSYTVTGNTLTAHVTSLNNLGNYITYFTVPGGTPANTPLDFITSVTTTSYTENTLVNNLDSVHSEVRNSWDPNDKNTNVPAIIDANTAEEIIYTVRFQNMGNDYAYNVTILDTIDSQFDLSTFRLVNQSHTGSYAIDPATRKVTFTFPNIYLTPQSVNDALSQGYVRYKIKENGNLPVNSVLNNTAYIYFDENAPVITNTTQNVNSLLGIDDVVADESVMLYPQPANSAFYLKGIDLTSIESIVITDMNGKVVMQQVTAPSGNGIQIENLVNGVYIVSLKTKNATVTKKLIVNH